MALVAGVRLWVTSRHQLAQLRFTPDRARWVAAETWHLNLKGRFDAASNWLPDLRHHAQADPPELVMDILRHLPEVEVLRPMGLRDAVAEKLRAGVKRMGERVTP